jgi:hypothetical protein
LASFKKGDSWCYLQEKITIDKTISSFCRFEIQRDQAEALVKLGNKEFVCVATEGKKSLFAYRHDDKDWIYVVNFT